MPLGRSGSATLQWHGTTSLYLLIAVLLTTLPAPTSLYCHAAGETPRHHPPPPPPPQQHHHQQQQQQHQQHQRSPLHLLNPWVSACDLATPAEAPDLQGTCSTVMTDAELVATYPNNTINNNNNNKYNNKHTNNLHQSNNASTVDPRQRGPGPPLGRDTYSCPPGCPGGDAKPSGVVVDAASRRQPGEAAQCLYYLNESHREALCGRKKSSSSSTSSSSTLHMTDKVRLLRSLRLRHCCEHSAAGALSEAAWEAVRAGGDACRLYLGALLELDQLAARVTCEFNEILVRYDCGQAYSVKYACDDCKESYRQWVCSSLVPHFARNASKVSDNGDDGDGGDDDVGRLHRIRPCRDVCQQVEQRCPYFLPGDRAPSYPTQYAGEPTFLCLDPNIPETGEQLTRSSYGDAQCCYTMCGAAGICPHRGCARPNNHTYPAACPAQSQLNALPGGGATGDSYQRSACAVPANQVQVTQRAVTSGTSKLSIANCCWTLQILQFYVVMRDVILNSLLRILFRLVNGPERIYVFGYT